MAMTDDVRPGELFEIESADSDGWLMHLPWWLIAALAFAVAELTAHPSIGVIVLCLKFGWNDFLTALWLRRRDPNQRRGTTCFWFYLSSGLWRVCIWSFLLLFGTVTFAVMTELRQQRPPPGQNAEVEAVTCLIVWLLSSTIATLVSVLAVRIALRWQIKVWVSGSVSESRRRRVWPPQPNAARRNLLRWWLVTTGMALFVTLFLVGLFAMWLATKLVAGPSVPAGGGGGAVAMGLLLGICAPILAAVSILVIGSRIFARIGAVTPADCWPELVEYGYQTSVELRRESLRAEFALDTIVHRAPRRDDA